MKPKAKSEGGESNAGAFVDIAPGNYPKKKPRGREWKKDVIPGKPNRHVKSCGVPPTLDPRHPTGYFENDHGEQGVMQFDLETGICRVWMGDCGWDNEIRVELINGRHLAYYHPSRDDAAMSEKDHEFRQVWRKAVESIFGGMTEEEVRKASRMFPICPEEMKAITDFFDTNTKAYERVQRQRRDAKYREEQQQKRQERERRREESERWRTEREEQCRTRKEELLALKKLERTARLATRSLSQPASEGRSEQLDSLETDFILLANSPCTAPASSKDSN